MKPTDESTLIMMKGIGIMVLLLIFLEYTPEMIRYANSIIKRLVNLINKP